MKFKLDAAEFKFRALEFLRDAVLFLQPIIRGVHHAEIT